MSASPRIFSFTLCLMAASAFPLVAATTLPSPVVQFVDQHCADCHDDVEMKGDLDLWSLTTKPLDADNFSTWIKVHDRAKAHEMPPKKRDRPPSGDLAAFLDALSSSIVAYENEIFGDRGRAIKRRLNRYEYENALRDLLQLPYLEVKDSLPEDPTAYGFNKIGEALDVSHVQIARYLRVAEASLREAIAPQPQKPPLIHDRFYTWDQKGFIKGSGPTIRKTFPIIGHELQTDLLMGRDPVTREWIRPDLVEASSEDTREQEAVVMLMSTYEPAEIQFNNFRAPVAGVYRLRFSGYSVWMSPDFKKVSRGRRIEPVTVFSDIPPRLLRPLGRFDFGPEPTQNEITVWLKAGETIRPDATRLVRSRPPDFKNPLLEEDGMPGVAFQWMDVEGPLYEAWPPEGHQLMFGDLPISDESQILTDSDKIVSEWYEKPTDDSVPVVEFNGRETVTVEPRSVKADVDRLIRQFVAKAFRRPATKEELKSFKALILSAIERGHSFQDSMIAGYTAVLASPGFLYLENPKGALNGYALAERLSFFLWNSAPDEELRALAANGKLLKANTLTRQVDRLLDDDRSQRFVSAFLDYWLDLRNMSASGPDAELYPEYQLDDHLTESMVDETQAYFAKLIRENRDIRAIVDSDFATINGRLATLYDLPGIHGAAIRSVALPEGHARGGFMTQGSVLKVTANGTTSSPVTRGVWITERILGVHTPPPPASVQAIESDIRGATTIREQLALHRSEESCNQCHKKIDPVGFALENFDVMGGWRDRYRSASKGVGDSVDEVGHDGQIARYLLSQPVDATGNLPDGRSFTDIRELKALLLEDEEQLARNLANQLAVYATGAPVRFSDRAKIESILNQCQSSGYGIRDLIRELVKSDLFLYN